MNTRRHFTILLIVLFGTLGTAYAQDSTPPDDSDAITLTAYDQSIEDAIAELEELGLIPSGGKEVFQEPYAFFEGTGDWVTSLASYNPHTHIVMAGELTFIPGETDDIETCSFLSRIIMQGNRTSNYLEVGLMNSLLGSETGALFAVDIVNSEQNAFEFLPLLKIDIKEPHHILFMAFRETVTIYFDGEQMLKVEDLEERAGTYGVSLTGRGDNARCEGRNIWAWQVDEVVDFGDECGVRATNTVNLRSGPGTTYDRAGTLSFGQTEIIVGQAGGDDGFIWWQLESGNWVRSDVVTTGGECGDVPEIEP